MISEMGSFPHTMYYANLYKYEDGDKRLLTSGRLS